MSEPVSLSRSLLVQPGVELAGTVRKAWVIMSYLLTVRDGFLVGEFLGGSEVGMTFQLLVIGEVREDTWEVVPSVKQERSLK